MRTFVELPHGARQRIEALIAALIDLLDQIDGDDDDEPEDAEPVDLRRFSKNGGNGV
jgi:hypothetical protein